MSDTPAPAPPPAAPAAPAAPAPTPAPAAPALDIPQPATVQAPFNDAFADLEKMVAEKPPAPEPPKKKADAPPAKPKGDEPPAPPDPSVDKMAPPALRKAYNELKTKLEALNKERDELKADVDKREKTWGEKLTAHEKRLAENEKVLELVAYQRSEHYKTHFLNPFIDAYNNGRQAVSGIKIVGEDGNPRQGKPEDWDKYMQILDEDEAAEFAERTFGNRRGSVEYHRQVTLDKNRTREHAIAEREKLSTETEQKHAEALQEQRKAVGKLWSDANESAAKKYPQWFAPTDGDEEGNSLLERGMHLADRAFSNGQPLADGDRPLTPQEKVQLDSAIRNKAGAFDRIVLQNKRLQTKLAEAEKKIAEYEASEPGRGEGKRGEAGTPETWETQLEKMAKPRA